MCSGWVRGEGAGGGFALKVHEGSVGLHGGGAALGECRGVSVGGRGRGVWGCYLTEGV